MLGVEFLSIEWSREQRGKQGVLHLAPHFTNVMVHRQHAQTEYTAALYGGWDLYCGDLGDWILSQPSPTVLSPLIPYKQGYETI